jgi:hypothetical protein
MATTQNYYKVKHGLEAPTQDSIQVTDSSRPLARPSLLLDFANSKVLDPRITFARASTATYYDGKTTAKAEENLFLYSEQFDNAYWLKNGGTVTANTAVAPDGTTTADTISVNANSLGVYKTISNLLPGIYTWSVFLNGVAGTIVNVGVNTSSQSYQQVTLTGSWQRVSGQIPVTSDANFHFRSDYPVTAGQVGAFTCFAWGAQLEQRSSVTAYTPTTTQPITKYAPVLLTAASGVARFDHNPVTGESLGLLIEDQRTNVIPSSGQLHAVWTPQTAGDVLFISNAITAPDGTVSATKLVEGTTTSAKLGRYFSLSTGLTGAVTASFYIKAGERRYVWIYDSYIGFNAYFDAVTGIIRDTAGGTFTVTDAGNGWWRISATATMAFPYTNLRIYLLRTGTFNAGVTDVYAGDGYSGVYIWGHQYEAGESATSYIPTVASQVTRTSDLASMTGTNFSSWYRQDEGTVYVEADSTRPLGSFLSLIDIGVGISTTNRNTVGVNNNPVNVASVSNGIADLTANTSNFRTLGSIKVAYSAQDNNIAVCLNGGAVATDTSGIFLKTVDNLKIGVRNDNQVSLNGWISKVSYYPVKVSDAQLQGLTS